MKTNWLFEWFQKQVMRAKTKMFHLECFRCAACRRHLGIGQYLLQCQWFGEYLVHFCHIMWSGLSQRSSGGFGCHYFWSNNIFAERQFVCLSDKRGPNEAIVIKNTTQLYLFYGRSASRPFPNIATKSIWLITLCYGGWWWWWFSWCPHDFQSRATNLHCTEKESIARRIMSLSRGRYFCIFSCPGGRNVSEIFSFSPFLQKNT